MLQSATLTLYRAPIPAISCFDLFGSRSEIFGKLPQTFKISITDVWLLTKKVVSSVCGLYKKSCSNSFSLSMF